MQESIAMDSPNQMNLYDESFRKNVRRRLCTGELLLCPAWRAFQRTSALTAFVVSEPSVGSLTLVSPVWCSASHLCSSF